MNFQHQVSPIEHPVGNHGNSSPSGKDPFVEQTAQDLSNQSVHSQQERPQGTPPNTGDDGKPTKVKDERRYSTPLLEIIALIVSAAGLAAIIILLKEYDDKPLAPWTKSFSLNAVIGLLSQLSCATAVYAAAHGIGQLTWVWFSQRKASLNDIQAFQSGAHGVLGAIKFLYFLRFR